MQLPRELIAGCNLARVLPTDIHTFRGMGENYVKCNKGHFVHVGIWTDGTLNNCIKVLRGCCQGSNHPFRFKV